jgi:hypothetical protein
MIYQIFSSFVKTCSCGCFGCLKKLKIHLSFKWQCTHFQTNLKHLFLPLNMYFTFTKVLYSRSNYYRIGINNFYGIDLKTTQVFFPILLVVGTQSWDSPTLKLCCQNIWLPIFQWKAMLVAKTVIVELGESRPRTEIHQARLSQFLWKSFS